jgi:hypothetical protein
MGSGLPDERLGMRQVSKGNLRGNTFRGGLQKDVKLWGQATLHVGGI